MGKFIEMTATCPSRITQVYLLHTLLVPYRLLLTYITGTVQVITYIQNWYHAALSLSDTLTVPPIVFTDCPWYNVTLGVMKCKLTDLRAEI